MTRRILVLPVAAAIVLAASAFVVAGLPAPVPAPQTASLPDGSAISLASPGPTAFATGVPSPSPTSVAAPSPSPSASPAPSASPVLPAATGARLQRVLERLVRKAGIPGASVTIVWRDGSAWTGTTGLADVAGLRPVTPDTEFAIGSMTKTLTAALVLRLAEERRLGLDDPVAPLVPEATVPMGVTIRMLLDHTSGLADFFFGRGVDAALLKNRAATWSVARSLRYVGKPLFRPGRGWHYSNTNYLLLGLIAERVGGAPFAVQVRERFLDPLGLTGTRTQPAEGPHGPVAHGYRFRTADRTARPIDVSDGTLTVPFTSVVTAAGAAGNIAATSADLAWWAKALYGGAVLRPETLAAAVVDSRRTARYHPYVRYGLGLQVTRLGDRVAYGHSGRLLGFRGELRYLPTAGLSIAILTNQNRSDVSGIVRALVKLALPSAPGASASPAPGASASPSASPSPGTTTPTPAPTY